MSIRTIYLFFLVIPIYGFSVDYKPWFGTDFLLSTRLSELFQYYHTVDGGNKKFTYTSHDSFTTGSVSTTLFGDWSVEAATTFAVTRRQGKAFDNIALTGKYLAMNDVVGDPVSMAIGLTLDKAFKHSLHDPSSFHHGIYEAELFFSIGKECVQMSTWSRRAWGMLAFGLSERGNSWGRVQLHFEKNQCDFGTFYGFANFLFGFGDKNIRSINCFKGYGPIEHRSIDLGCGGSRLFDCDWNICLDLFYRVYARNFPSNALCVELTVSYPFFFGQ